MGDGGGIYHFLIIKYHKNTPKIFDKTLKVPKLSILYHIN